MSYWEQLKSNPDFGLMVIFGIVFFIVLVWNIIDLTEGWYTSLAKKFNQLTPVGKIVLAVIIVVVGVIVKGVF